MSLTNSPFWFSSGATSGGGGVTPVYPYSIDNSVRLETGGLEIVDSVNTGNNKTFTVSMWFKRTKRGVAQCLFGAGTGSDATFFFYIDDDDSFWYRSRYANTNGGAFEWSRQTIDVNYLIKDPSAWYHLVVATDTTRVNATSQLDYFDVWLNGENITSQFTNVRNTERSVASIYDDPLRWNTASSRPQTVGFYGAQGTDTAWFDGYLAEVHSVDGQALQASDFGQYSNGVWVPKEVSIANYGTRGFYFNFADSSNLGNDASTGGTEDYTANGVAAEDQVTDSPTNNFATWNHAGVQYGGTNTPTVSEGSLKAATSGNPTHIYSTFAIQSSDTQGYYWEVKATSLDAARSYLGIVAPEGGASGAAIGSYQFYYKFVLNMNGNFYGNNDVSATNVVALTSWTTNDILMFAYKEGKIWIGKNGTWMNSGDPAAGTGDLVAQDGGRPSDRGDVTWYPYAGFNSTYTANFGQEGTFAGTETAGNNSDANGYGNFKYAVPSGFLALCSANLPEPVIGPNQASGEQSDNYFEAIKYIGNGAVQHIGSGGSQHPIDTTTIANSIRFNDSDNPRLSLDPIGTPTLGTKCTISFWFKRGVNFGSTGYLFTGEQSNLYYDHLHFTGGGENKIFIVGQENASSYGYKTVASFKDSSKWYHVVLECDSTQATGTDRYKLYVDGVQQSLTSVYGVHPQNHLWYWNKSGNSQNIGRSESYGNSFDGYLAEFYFIDGQALDATNFGQYGSNGYWIPKAVSGLTFGDNGFYLDFSDNSTATALGTDSSGNTPPNNFSVTGIATTDQMGDSPTQNFNTLNPNGTNFVSYAVTLSEGNLKAAALQAKVVNSMFGVTSGKYYFETKSQSGDPMVGVALRDGSNSIVYDGNVGYVRNYAPINGSPTNRTGYATWTTTDIIGVAFDVDNNQVEFFKNNTSIGTFNFIMNSETVATAGYQGGTDVQITFNFGADDSFAGNATGGAGTADGNGYGSFYYTPPTGFLALVDDNIPVEGLTGPDFVWIKNRDNVSTAHSLFDTIRGPELRLSSNSTTVEQTKTGTLTSFDYDGFTTGENDITNKSGSNFVAWTWKAGGKANTFNVDGTGYASMTAAGLTDGTIPLTGLSVNTTAGFSILSWTGNTTNPSTIAHGLSSAPEMIILKNRDLTGDWYIGHDGIGWTDRLKFTATNTASSITLWNNTAPTDSVFTISSALNFNGDATIAYCFHSVEGFSKAGSYVGNGQNSPNGTFVYTGFRPAFVMVKDATDTSQWIMIDNLRANPYNINTARLYASLDAAEAATNTNRYMELFSNGFRVHGNNAADDANKWNESNDSYIYIAFAEVPFKYANAR